MKKVFALPLFAMAALVSQGWTAYQVCTGEYAGSCKWSGECSVIGIDPGADWSKATCKEAYENCKNNSGGNLYSDDACANKVTGADIPETCGYDCDWGTGGCYEIKTDPNGVNGPAITTCSDAIANCDAGGTRYSSTGDKCTGTVLGGKDPNAVALGCCKWNTETGCYTIWSGSEDDVTNCKSGDNKFWSSKCPSEGTCPNSNPVYPPATTSSSSDGNNNSSSSNNNNNSSSSSSSSNGTPILNTPASVSLVVAPFSRSLYISSAKDATVSLYDMSGVKVYSGKVRAGSGVLSLEKVSSGSYYAIVQSGYVSKKVPVILK